MIQATDKQLLKIFFTYLKISFDPDKFERIKMLKPWMLSRREASDLISGLESGEFDMMAERIILILDTMNDVMAMVRREVI